MVNRRIVIISLVAGAVLLLAAGGLYLFLSSTGRLTTSSLPSPTPPIPTIEITPPPSLEELAEQYPEFAEILKDPELGSVYKEFLLVYEAEGKEAALELARKRGLLTLEDDIRVTLVLDTEDHAALVEELEGVGVTVVSVYRDRINVAVPVALIEEQLASDEPGAVFAQLTELEHIIAVQIPELRAPDADILSSPTHYSSIDGEGIAVIGAGGWHNADFTGRGLRVGVLDLGFDGYEGLLESELPDDVAVETFGWYEDEVAHGTACAEIIHEIAPGAELFFAWYDGSDAAMGAAMDWLMEQDVDIISHSASSLAGPRDGSGWDAQQVDELASQGVLWVNSAGNAAESHYRGNFTDEDGDGYHEFKPGKEMLPLLSRSEVIQVVLNWEDDWEQPAQDYDLYLYDTAGNELVASEDIQSGQVGQEPVEGFEYETGGKTVYASVLTVDRAVTLDIFAYGADVAFPSPDRSLCPPADAVGALTVGAVDWDDDILALYSSRGPTSDGRLKPEISAPTGVSGATYGPRGFDGTSASAPHVAGAAALVWQAYPSFTRQEVLDYLLARAVDLGPGGPDTGYGYGRLALPAPPAAAETPSPTAVPADTPTPAPSPATPTATSTSAPLPTPTQIAYVTPTPEPSGGGEEEGDLLPLSNLGLIMGGLGCVGMVLLLVGGVSILVLTRRGGQVQRPPGPPPASPLPPTERSPYMPEPSPPSPPLPSEPSPPPDQTRCESCGARVRSQARFCPVCGYPLVAKEERRPLYCRHCGARLRKEARFCPECGRSVERGQ